MFRSEQAKMKAYKANLGLEAKNNFKQGEALDRYLMYEKGIETQEQGMSKFADAIGDSVGKTIRIVGPTDKIKNWSVDESVSGKPPKVVAPPKGTSVDDSGNVIRAQSKNPPKSITQPQKPNTLIILTTLNAEQDLALRKKFDNVLDGIASQAKTVDDKRLWKQMKAAIEKQCMADVYKEWVETQVKSAFANKIQRNLQMLLNEKKANKAIDENKAQRGFIASNKRSTIQELQTRNKAATTIANTLSKRMAHLRSLKATKADNQRNRLGSAFSTTSTGSLSDGSSPVDIDGRQSNKGKPKYPSDVYLDKSKEELERLIRNDYKTKTEKKRIVYLKKTLAPFYKAARYW